VKQTSETIDVQVDETFLQRFWDLAGTFSIYNQKNKSG
jgi:hypothetical protein